VVRPYHPSKLEGVRLECLARAQDLWNPSPEVCPERASTMAEEYAMADDVYDNIPTRAQRAGLHKE
jgi:hypothetical protein